MDRGELFELLKKGLRWKRQGAKNKWSTEPSQALWDGLTEVEKKFRIHGDKCYCGQELPWHLVDIGGERFSHICSCERKFIYIIDGLLMHDGEQINPFARYDKEHGNGPEPDGSDVQQARPGDSTSRGRPRARHIVGGRNDD